MPYEDRYFEWLIEKIAHNGLENNHYHLLDLLYSKKFTWIVSNDDNRAADGERLRNEFGWDGRFSGCSVLEMMIALARRIDRDIMGEPGSEDRTYKWFWEMIDNLGLLIFNDARFDSDMVNYILDDWLNRRFKPDGRGSIFPLKRPLRDQRNIEIWFQLCSYLDENYEIE